MLIVGISSSSIYAQVAFDGYIISACSGNIALCVTNNVHIDNAVCCSNCSVFLSLSFFYNNVATVDINYTTASISIKSVSIALEVNITINSNVATVAASHAACSIKTRCTIISPAAVIAVNVQFYIAINNNVASVINTNGIVITIYSNIHITINGQLSSANSNINTFQAAITNLTAIKVHFYSTGFYIQSISISIIDFNTCTRYTSYVLNIQG